jgi:hypothetical protein
VFEFNEARIKVRIAVRTFAGNFGHALASYDSSGQTGTGFCEAASEVSDFAFNRAACKSATCGFDLS